MKNVFFKKRKEVHTYVYAPKEGKIYMMNNKVLTDPEDFFIEGASYFYYGDKNSIIFVPEISDDFLAEDFTEKFIKCMLDVFNKSGLKPKIKKIKKQKDERYNRYRLNFTKADYAYFILMYQKLITKEIKYDDAGIEIAD